MKRTNIIITALLGLLLWNCTERIQVEVDSSFTRLVVEGAVTTDTTVHWVRLSTTSDYFINLGAPAVSNATVTIDDGETAHTLTESDTMPGYYTTAPDYHGVPGRTYVLNIRDVDIDRDGISDEYSASSELRGVNPLDSIKLRRFDAFGFLGWEIQVYAWDSPEKDWYAFKAHKNGVLLTDTLYELIVQNDDFFNGNYTNGITSQFLADDKPDELVMEGDTITFEINGITEGYYNYIVEAQSQVFPQTPLFSGPPANIRTNLDNDAIGYFVAYSVQYSSAIATFENN
jgi:hypothetical protein